jgi:hypothetical protein
VTRLTDLPPALAKRLAELDCPDFTSGPWVTSSARSQRGVTMVSSAGLAARGETPFRGRDVITGPFLLTPKPEDLLISHISTNFHHDRLDGGDPLFVYGRHRPSADGASCPRIGRPAEGGHRRRGHSPLGLTALHARRERAGALSGGGRDCDGRIALIRPHAENTRPPRALCVPFELGPAV